MKEKGGRGGGTIAGVRQRVPSAKNGGVPSTARPSHLGGRASGTWPDKEKSKSKETRERGLVRAAGPHSACASARRHRLHACFHLTLMAARPDHPSCSRRSCRVMSTSRIPVRLVPGSHRLGTSGSHPLSSANSPRTRLPYLIAGPHRRTTRLVADHPPKDPFVCCAFHLH